MKYKFNNPITNRFETFDTKEEAETRLLAVKAEYILQEDYRFPVAKEIVEGNNTTWMAADLSNGTEEYAYKVFNHLTGLYEEVSSLTTARLRNQELKDAFLTSVFSSGIIEYEEPQPIPSIPATTV